jgi:hypothetical protein
MQCQTFDGYTIRSLKLWCSIFFVSGLLAPARSQSSAWDSAQFSWPQELGRDITNARIMSWEFSPGEDGYGPDSIDKLGEHFLHEVELTKSGSEAASRPSIFIAHSLGGLIVKSVSKYFDRINKCLLIVDRPFSNHPSCIPLRPFSTSPRVCVSSEHLRLGVERRGGMLFQRLEEC